MKKNITINLFGTLYNIDEDAYQLLDSYLQSMKRYFGRKEGGDEIANDIEHRVAELLWARKEQGMEAVNLDVIKEIIETIGNAEEIAGADGEEGSDDKTSDNYSKETENGEQYDEATATPWQRFRHYFRDRRLFRDPEDKMLGGVCSGLSYYIGFGDPVLWRLLLLLAFLFHGAGLIAYLILWLIVPEARTPEDRLRMKGVQPSPESINKQILQDQGKMENKHTSGGQSNGSGCLKVLLGLILLPPMLFLLLIIGIFVSVSGAVVGGIFAMDSYDGRFLNGMFNMMDTMTASGIVCLIIVLVLCFILLIRWLFGSNKSMASGTKWTLSAIIVLGLIWAIFSISRGVGRAQSWLREHPLGAMNYSRPKAKPQPGLDIPYLTETSFYIVTNSTARCTWSGDYPTGDGDRRYLDACDYHNTLCFTAERTDTVKPGVYDLYALARANDEGAYIYVQTYVEELKANRRYEQIPEEGNEQGNLWKWSTGNATIDGMEEAYPAFCTDSIRQQISSVNDSQGFGWSVLCIKDITVGSNGKITYGITTDQAFTGEEPECDWVSATDFVLVPGGKRR